MSVHPPWVDLRPLWLALGSLWLAVRPLGLDLDPSGWLSHPPGWLSHFRLVLRTPEFWMRYIVDQNVKSRWIESYSIPYPILSKLGRKNLTGCIWPAPPANLTGITMCQITHQNISKGKKVFIEGICIKGKSVFLNKQRSEISIFWA